MQLKPLSIFSMRAAMTLAFTVLTTMTVGATQFITEVKLIGYKEEAKFNQLQSDLEEKGWKPINKDLNAGCGSSSDYIHLLYKAEENTDGLNHGYVTDFYITASTSSKCDEEVTYNGRTYYLVPYDGSKEFNDSKGDLNRGAGGNYIHLYYTKAPLDEELAVTGISFNDNKKDGVNDKKGTDGIDLNKGCGSDTDYIYMHITTEKATTIDWGIDNGADGSEEHPYVITTTDGLDLLAKMVNSGTEYAGKFFNLGADIEYAHETDWNDAKSTENNYTAIGYYDDTNDYYFKGHFNGCGHTVKGIRIYKGGRYFTNGFQGLFGQIGEDGSVSHVTLDDARITGWDSTGGIAGFNEGGTITDCHVTATVCIHAVQTDADYHGGIIGGNVERNSGTVSGCTSRAVITIADGVGNCREYGGIAGYNQQGAIKDCLYLGGQVGGNLYVGAIAGVNNNGTIENCYYTDRGFTGKDEEGNAVMLSGGNPAIGSHYEDCTEKNVGLARTITLGEGVVLGGTATNYAEDIKNPAQHLTTYANGASVFALELTTNSSGTTIYSLTDATVGIKYDGELPTGTVPAFTVAHANGDVFIVSKDGDNYTFIMPADNVTVAAGDLWGIGNGADGSEENPYVITTTAGLDLLAKMVNSGTEYEGKFFVLDADIEYAHETDWNDAKSTESNYTAIGGFIDNYWRYFEGHFDGCGHTVKGIRIYKGGTDNFENYQGLFGQIGEGGSVSHLTLDDTRITGFDFTGGIAGFIKHGTITDCHVTTTVCIHAVQTDAYYHGGIVGHNNKSNSGTVSGCTSRAVITIADGIRNCLGYGGIIGHDQSSIKDCLYLGSEVGGNRYVGAIVGWNEGGTIENCYYTDANFKGKKTNGDDITLDNGNPAIGYHDDGYTEKNVGFARTITLGEGVVLSGTTTDYAKDVKNPIQHLTTYAAGDGVFALALTTSSDGTTIYSLTDATVGIKYDGELPTGAVPTFTVTKSDKTTVTVTDTYTFEMPADNVTVTVKVKLPGDVNGDLKVDAADIMAVLKIMLENGYDQKADVNNDNKVDIADIITIVNIMSGS